MTQLLRVSAIIVGVAYLIAGLWGVRAAMAFQRGSVLAAQGRYDEALPLLERGAVGFNAAEAGWLAGEVAVGLADGAPDASVGSASLRRACAHYLDLLRATTGSAYALTGLASVRERAEAAERRTRVVDLTSLSSGPWALVGANGREAVGLLSVAVAREPATCAAHDALVRLLVTYSLVEEAKAAARNAALAAPAFEYHLGLEPDRLPPEVVEAFAAGAREALGAAPLVTRERKLFYLGLLEERIGRLDRAIEDLALAHAQPAPRLEHAESAFHLGRILVRLGRVAEAEAAWREADREPVFRPGLAVERARIAEAGGRQDEALRQIAEARRIAPRRMDLILWEAGLLASRGDNTAAADTLRWGLTVDGSDRAPRRALVIALIGAGDRAAADQVLTEFERDLGEGDDTRELRARLESAP